MLDGGRVYFCSLSLLEEGQADAEEWARLAVQGCLISQQGPAAPPPICHSTRREAKTPKAAPALSHTPGPLGLLKQGQLSVRELIKLLFSELCPESAG